jgi:multiple sugar transport system substrate-binding protein
MKRQVLFLMALLCATGMVFASGNQAGARAATNAPAKIEFWNDKIDPIFTDQLSTALKDASGVQVDFVNYPDVAAYQTAVQQTIRQSGAPGLFTWWSGPQLETLVQNGIVADLTDTWKNYLVPAGVSADIGEAFRVNGKIYAAPYSVLYNETYYNKTAFAKAGLAREPATFEEFVDACAKLKAAGITPIGLKNDSWASFIWFEQFVAVYDPQLYSDLCNGTRKYTGGEMREVLNIWKDLIDKGYFSSPLAYADHLRSFALGETAMILEPNTVSSSLIRDYGAKPGTDYDVFVIPAIGGNKKRVIFFEASPICIAQASASRETAFKALQNFYAVPVQQILVNETGIANTSTVKIEDTVVQKMFSFGSQPNSYQLLLRFYENTPSDLRDVVITEMSRFMYGQASVDQVLTTIQAKADSVFKK